MKRYNPKGALSPRLAKVMAKLAKVIQDEDLMATITLSDGKDTEFFCPVDPDWSCIRMAVLPGGDVAVRIRAAVNGEIERTVKGLTSMYQILECQLGNLTGTMAKLKSEVLDAAVVEPPRTPQTVEEAADMILGTMTPEMLAWVKTTSLIEAGPHIHHGFGREIRNSWSLWEDTPLRRDIQERFKLFGHGDDLSHLIFTVLWARVRGEDPRLEEEVEHLKAHWRKEGFNPETGEEGIILP